MVLNIVKFHTHVVVIKITGFKDQTPLKLVNICEQRTIDTIWTIIELEEDIIALNNVTKFYKILIKTV